MCEYIIVEDFNMDKHIFNEDILSFFRTIKRI